MRIVFLGTPEFAVPTLERAFAAGHEIAAVVTQPDRPKGRGRQLAAPPVKETALRLGLAVHQPERIRTPEAIELLAGLKPDAMVVVGYGKIIPQAIIDIPRHGIVNVHASLLPKYRGAAPVQWAIANGESETGVTTMRIDAGLDTGDILKQRKTEIGLHETAVELAQRLAAIGAALLVETLAGLERGEIVPRPQNSAEATFAPVLKKEDGRIDWTRPAAEISNRIRGFTPWPGCFTHLRGKAIEISRARATAGATGEPGSVHPIRGRLVVTCGEGTALEILEVQMEGRKRMDAAAFQNGYHLMENELLRETIQ
ncbi:MAG: methionyl-tRNA formyltransferase, partial [Bryobacteraceae bacterium]